MPLLARYGFDALETPAVGVVLRYRKQLVRLACRHILDLIMLRTVAMIVGRKLDVQRLEEREEPEPERQMSNERRPQECCCHSVSAEEPAREANQRCTPMRSQRAG